MIIFNSSVYRNWYRTGCWSWAEVAIIENGLVLSTSTV